MQNFYTVIQQYEDSNPDPIILNTGDVVQLGEEYKEDAAWPNWIRCISKKTGKSGWTPRRSCKSTVKQLLQQPITQQRK